MLPASKDEFPKCLYLDQNKWIDLAKAHYGKPGGEPFREYLEVVRAAVNSGKLVVPFSVVNAIESMIATDSARRERTAKFIVELSRNHTFAPDDALCWMEIGNAMAGLFGRGTIRAVRSDAVRTGVAHMMGMDVRVDAPLFVQGLLASFMNSEQLTMKFLLESGERRELIAGSRAGEAGARDVFERDRAELSGMPLGARRRIELNHLLIDPRRVGSYRRAIDAALHDVGGNIDQFLARVGSEQDAIDFLSGIPNLDVLLTLRTARDRDRVRAIDHNDIRDLDAMSIAVPYCNVIVVEKYWGHQVVATRLDAKYGTKVLTDLRELPKELRLIGCEA